jgi:hypothetical protein
MRAQDLRGLARRGAHGEPRPRLILRRIFSLRGCRSVGICDPEIVLRRLHAGRLGGVRSDMENRRMAA